MTQHSFMQKALALALLLLLPVVAFFGAYRPIVDHIGGLQTDAATRIETIARLKAGLVQGQRLSGALSAEAMQSLAGDYLVGEQDSLVSADLQAKVRTIAVGANVDLNSANTLPVRVTDGIKYIGVRVALRGQLTDVQRVLHSIETQKPILFVERAVMRLEAWQIGTGATGNRDGLPMLYAEFDIYGGRLPVLTQASSGAAAPSGVGGAIGEPQPGGRTP